MLLNKGKLVDGGEKNEPGVRCRTALISTG